MTTGKRLLSKIKPYSKIIEGIAHPYRLAMVHLLAQKPMAERDFIRRLKIKQPLASHHITLLHKAGWIKKKRIGKMVTYVLQPKAKDSLVSLLPASPKR